MWAAKKLVPRSQMMLSFTDSEENTTKVFPMKIVLQWTNDVLVDTLLADEELKEDDFLPLHSPYHENYSVFVPLHLQTFVEDFHDMFCRNWHEYAKNLGISLLNESDFQLIFDLSKYEYSLKYPRRSETTQDVFTFFEKRYLSL